MRFSRLVRAMVLICGCAVATTWSLAGPQDQPKPAFPPLKEQMRNVHAYLQSEFSNAKLHPPAERDGTRYYVFSLEFNNTDDCQSYCNQFQTQGMTILTRFEQFAEVMFPLDDKKAYAQIDNAYQNQVFRWLECTTNLPERPPSAPTAESNGKSYGYEKIIRSSEDIYGLTGKGSIIAILDTGVDFTHTDFIANDGSSRLLYFWDTVGEYKDGGPGKPAEALYPPDAAHPKGTPIGVVYSREDLNKELKADASHKQLGLLDEDGHGTACAGIAAGGGREEKKLRGVAPGADLIAVRLSKTNPIQNDWLLNRACEWLDQVAGDRPLIISYSVGVTYGGRDGMTIAERQLSARFPGNRKGRVICIAAGNEGSQKRHAHKEFDKDSPLDLQWHAARAEMIEIYINRVADNGTASPAQPEDFADPRFKGVNPESVLGFRHGISKAAVIRFSVTEGDGNFYLETASQDKKQKFQADAYIVTSGPRSKERVEGSYSQGNVATNGRQISMPGAAFSALTIGSFDFNDDVESVTNLPLTDPDDGKPLDIGNVSRSCNFGGLRIGKLVKPDIAAPGRYFPAPHPDKVIQRMLDDKVENKCVHRSHKYAAVGGTSAATPYAAGVCALLLERKRDLSADDIRALFNKWATTDDKTGMPPKVERWGRGKLDLSAVQHMAADLKK